jgi:heat shock protein HtpX
MAKRIFLFLAVNVLVVVTLSVVMSLLGVQPYLNERGLDYRALLVFCLLWGMGGAFISLAISRIMAKTFMGVQVVDPHTTDPGLRQLLHTVQQLASAAAIPMPQVGVYASPEVNAFATGPTKSRSLVAVSSGLLQSMDRNQVEGVLSHEIAHIANGDMVTMTLLQGVVNAFAMFLARVIAFAIAQVGRGRDEEGQGFSQITFFITTMVLEMVFLLLGSIVVAWFSRQREYRADAGGARLGGREKMIGALEALQRSAGRVDPNTRPALQTLKISSPGRGLAMLFATHPPLAQRIEKLRSAL